jgi:cytochrome P450
MRDDAPIQNTRRFATSDVRFGEAHVRRGDMVIVVLAGAAGCPFGHGRHRCPGEHVALAIAREVVGFAVENGTIPDETCDPVRYHPSGNARIPDLEGKDAT